MGSLLAFTLLPLPFVIGMKATSSSTKAGYGVKSSKDIKAMEKAQPLSDHRLAIDAVILFESIILLIWQS